MNKQVFFLHSAGAQGPHEGSSDLVAWLKDALGSECHVLHPKMPNPKEPDYQAWKAELRKELAKLSGEVTFVGHSLGGSVLLKYLAEEPFTNPITGCFSSRHRSGAEMRTGDTSPSRYRRILPGNCLRFLASFCTIA